MRIRYVVSTMVFKGREHPLSFEQECQFLKSLGFGVELLPNIENYNECRYSRKNWSRLLEATKDMLVSMRSRNDGPTLEEWQEQIECARLLRANIVTDLRSLRVAEGCDHKDFDFASEVIGCAEQNDVKLCIETGSLPAIKQVADKFDSVGCCLDIGFINLDPIYSFKKYLDELAEKTCHIHLTDNYGRRDDHQPPGLRNGINKQDWSYLLQALNKYNADVIGSLEMAPSMPDIMIHQACEFLFDVLKWPNRPQKKLDLSNVSYNPV